MSNNRIQVEIILGAIAIIISSILLLVVGFRETDKLEESAVHQEALAIEFGAQLYTANCAECHGVNGEGLFGPPFNDEHFFTNRLQEVGWAGTMEDFIVSTASSGRPASTRPDEWPGKPESPWKMPAWSTEFGGPLRPDQIRAIAAYIMNWAPAATGTAQPPEILSEPGLKLADPVNRGKSTFTRAGCVACHTIQGFSSGAVGPELTHIATVAETRVTGQSAEDYIRDSILNPNDFIVPDCPTGPCASPSVMLATFGDTLSEEQINDLVTYLLSLE